MYFMTFNGENSLNIGKIPSMNEKYMFKYLANTESLIDLSFH